MTIRRAALTAAALAASLAACTVEISERTVFNPPKLNATPPPIAVEGVSVEEGRFGATERELAYTRLMRDDRAGPLIVFCGGNAFARANNAHTVAKNLAPFGDVFMFDYPGYGDSAGEVGVEDFRAAQADVEAFARDIARPGQAVVAWGHSLGGFVCSELAAGFDRVDALVIETSAPSTDAVIDAWTPWYAAPVTRVKVEPDLASFDTPKRLERFAGPILVLGAGRDETLPVWLSRALAERLEELGRRVDYVEFAEARHTTVAEAPGFSEAIATFLDEVSPPRPATGAGAP